MHFFIRAYQVIIRTYTCRNPPPPAIHTSLFILTWVGVWCRFLVLSTYAYFPLAHPE